MAAKSFSQGTFTASEIHVYIQDDNHDKENIEHQVNIEKISSQLTACVTAGELSSTIMNFFGRLTA